MKKSSTIQGDLNGLLSKHLILQRQNTVKPYLNKKRNILDLGCGVFRWDTLLQPDTRYTGIDIEPDIISYNQKYYPQYSFFLNNIDKESLSFLQSSFDLVIMLAVLEHLTNPIKILKEVGNILTDDGVIILSTPHPRGEKILEIGSHFKIFSQDKHQHQPLINKEKMQSFARQSDLSITDFQSFLFGFNQKIVLKKRLKTGEAHE